jgi:hypothetical protein
MLASVFYGTLVCIKETLVNFTALWYTYTEVILYTFPHFGIYCGHFLHFFHILVYTVDNFVHFSTFWYIPWSFFTHFGIYRGQFCTLFHILVYTVDNIGLRFQERCGNAADENKPAESATFFGLDLNKKKTGIVRPRLSQRCLMR